MTHLLLGHIILESNFRGRVFFVCVRARACVFCSDQLTFDAATTVGNG